MDKTYVETNLALLSAHVERMPTLIDKVRTVAILFRGWALEDGDVRLSAAAELLESVCLNAE